MLAQRNAHNHPHGMHRIAWHGIAAPISQTKNGDLYLTPASGVSHLESR